MAIDLGDVVPLSVTIRDSAGVLANAGTLTLTVTLPDGTSFLAGTILPTSLGTYSYDYVTIQPGRHRIRWVATGANASAFADSFDVVPADNGDFISLTDTKNHLRLDLQATTYDEALRGFISAACQMVTDRMGPVSPTTVVEINRQTDVKYLVLDQYPIISITAVETLPGPIAMVQGDEATNVQGWILDKPKSGIIKHTDRFIGKTRITYRAGRTPVPPNFVLATKELVGNLWRISQLNPGGGRPPMAQEDQAVNGIPFALPFSVRQLLGLDKRSQRSPLV